MSMNTYRVWLTAPITLSICVDVYAQDDESAQEHARNSALNMIYKSTQDECNGQSLSIEHDFDVEVVEFQIERNNQ